MASIYWDMEHYSACERVFKQSAEFLSEHETWKLNVAHTFFMQDNHYKEAIKCAGRAPALLHEVACVAELVARGLRPAPADPPPQVLRAHCGQEQGQPAGSDCHCPSQPLRVLHHDQPSEPRLACTECAAD